jgi:hypothetical protein
VIGTSLLVTEDPLGNPVAGPLAEATELRALEDLDDVGVPPELVAFLLPGRQVAAHEAQARVVQRHAHGDAALVAEAPHDAAADAGEADVANVRHQLPPRPHRREQPHHLLARHQAVPLAPAAAVTTVRRGRRRLVHDDVLLLLLVRRRHRVTFDSAPARAAHQARRPARPSGSLLRRAGARLEPAPRVMAERQTSLWVVVVESSVAERRDQSGGVTWRVS